MHVDPTDTVSAIKGKLQELLQKVRSAAGVNSSAAAWGARPQPACPPSQPAQDQRLYDKDGAELEDNRSLAEMRVENDDEISVTYRLDGGLGGERPVIVGRPTSPDAWPILPLQLCPQTGSLRQSA